MTALSDALTEAQAGAMKALTKAIIAGQMGDEEAKARLENIGLTDLVDTGHWLASLEVLRELGGTLENGAKPLGEPTATSRQMDYLRSLADDKGVVLPDRPWSQSKASEAITQLKAGTFDPASWEVPF